MRKPIFAEKPKEYVLDVTKSFAYEAHCQPKKIVNKRTSQTVSTLSKKLKEALQKLLISLAR